MWKSGKLEIGWGAGVMLALALLAGGIAVRYVREGRTAGPRWENVLCWILAALLVIWGVVRNLP